jgi:hypothetical protein
MVVGLLVPTDVALSTRHCLVDAFIFASSTLVLAKMALVFQVVFTKRARQRTRLPMANLFVLVHIPRPPPLGLLFAWPKFTAFVSVAQMATQDVSGL